MIIEVASLHVKSDPNVKNQFEQALLCHLTLDPIREAATAVYTEFLCKLCNSNIAERIGNTVRTKPFETPYQAY